MSKKLSLFIIISVLVFGGHSASAVTLQPAASVTVSKPVIIDNTVNFTLNNNQPTQQLEDLSYAIRVEDASGSVLQETIGGTVVFNASGASTSITKLITLPSTASGTYNVYIIVKNKKGILLASSYAGTITATAQQTTESSLLSNCELFDASTASFVCTATVGEGQKLSYRLYQDSAFGDLAYEGLVDGFESDTPFELVHAFAPGTYEVAFELTDSKGVKYPMQQNVIFTVPGSWVAVDYLLTDINASTLDASIRFAGDNISGTTGFIYWVVDDAGKACAHGELNIELVPSVEMHINEQIPADCISPSLAGVLYNGYDEDGSLNVVGYVGNADFESLLADYNSGLLPMSAYLLFGVIVIILIVGYFIIHNKKEDDDGAGEREDNADTNNGGLSAATTIAVFAIVLFMPAAFTHAAPAAATYFSQDNPNVMFSVNFDKEAYLPDEDITFSFGLVDRDSGNKPADSSVSVDTDGGTATEVISTSDSGSYYHLSTAGASEEGTHTINFVAPGLCGSAFNYSLFGIALFGTSDCEFSIDVEVSADAEDTEAPTSPIIYGQCVVGESNDFTFYSYDTQGNDVMYEINWGDGTSGTIPASGYVPSGTAQTATHTWDEYASFSVQSRAIDTEGNGSQWSTTAVLCGDGDDGDDYGPGGSGCEQTSNFGISANPWLVRQGDTSTVRWWAIRGLSGCNITGNGDSWSGTQGEETTSAIEEQTTYTISCYSTCAEDNVSTTTVINIAPNWQEF